MTDALLVVEDVAVSYGHVRALEPLGFTLDPGQLVMLLGPNGAGKTTLLRALAGAVPVDHGRVLLQGRDVTRISAERRVGLGIALVPEGRGVLPGLTVAENLDLGRRAGKQLGERTALVAPDEVMALFPILSERLRQDCQTLSGGEMQMLSIARALLCGPRVLLLDEPSLGLGPQVVRRVYEVLGDLLQRGLSLVVAEQKAVSIRALADPVIVLQAGRVSHRGPGAALSQEALSRLYFGGAA